MEENTPPSGLGGKITVNEAVAFTTSWRTYLTTSGQAFNTHAFLVPISSVKNLVEQNPDATGMRIYLGLEDATQPTTGKVILVPVIDGNDVIFISGGGHDGDEEDDSNLYDRSSPCPPSCSNPNELNP